MVFNPYQDIDKEVEKNQRLYYAARQAIIDAKNKQAIKTEAMAKQFDGKEIMAGKQGLGTNAQQTVTTTEQGQTPLKSALEGIKKSYIYAFSGQVQPKVTVKPLKDTGTQATKYVAEKFASGYTLGLYDIAKKLAERALELGGIKFEEYKPPEKIEKAGTAAVVAGGVMGAGKIMKGAGLATEASGVKSITQPVIKTIGENLAKIVKLAKQHPVITGLVGAGAAATGVEAGRGALEPEYAERRDTLPSKAGASFRTGVAGGVESLGYYAKKEGHEDIAKTLIKTAEGMKEGFEVEPPKQISWKSIFDPEFYATVGAQALGSSALMIPAIFASWKLFGGAGARLGLSPFGRVIVSALGSGITNRMVESAMEAGDTYGQVYNQEKSKGKTEAEAHELADKAAQETFNKNMTLTGLDIIELGLAFGEGGVTSQIAKRIGKTGLAATKVATEAGLGGFEEGMQYAFQQQAQGLPVDLGSQEAIASILGGATIGGGLGMVGGLKDAVRLRIVGEAPEEIKTQIKENVQQKINNGVEENEAIEQAFDELAETPEGKEVIKKITKDISKEIDDETNKAVQELDLFELNEEIPTKEVKTEKSIAEEVKAEELPVAAVESDGKPAELIKTEITPAVEAVESTEEHIPVGVEVVPDEEIEVLKQNMINVQGVKPAIENVVVETPQEIVPEEKIGEVKRETKETFQNLTGEPVEEESSTGEFSVSPSDIPYELAYRAHANTSHMPDERAKQEQQNYYQHMKGLYDEFKAKIKPEQHPQLVREMEKYKKKYLQKYLDLLNNHSKIASAMVVGPAKFPTAKMEKYNNAYEKKLKEFIAWRERAINEIAENLGIVQSKIISSDDPEAIRKIKEKIEALEKQQEFMKKVNKIAKSKLPETEKIKQIMALGASEENAKKILEPDQTGEVGFPAWTLRNNNAEIRRLKTRLNTLMEQKAETTQSWEYDGIKIVDNVEENRLQIFFDSKPDEETRNQLKKHGFKWSPSNGAWQRHRSSDALYWAKKILNIKEQSSVSEQAIKEKNEAKEEKPIKNLQETEEVTKKAESKEKLAETKKETTTSKEEKIITGKKDTVKTEKGTAIEVRYAIVEANDLISSHDENLKVNPDYPKELQPRDRTRLASELQVNRIAKNLEPEFLGKNPKASEGAPIVGKDMIVESGNGRVIALKRIYKNNMPKTEEYKKWLKENALDFGISPEDIDKFDFPVLVRIRESDIDRIKFVEEANEQNVAAMSTTEQAQNDAKKMTFELMSRFVPSENGEILTAFNRGFIHDFMNDVVGENEKPKYMTSDGSISQEGVNRIRNAVFAKAYGDPAILEKMAESTDNNIKNITNGLLIAAPKIAALKARIEAGDLYDLDITNEIVDAVTKYSYLKEEGMTVDEYLAQGSMFTEELNPLAKTLLYYFEQNKRSAKKIANLLSEYTEVVKALGNPNQGTMFDELGEIPTKEELLAIVLSKGENENVESISLFTEGKSGESEETGRMASQTGTGEEEKRETELGKFKRGVTNESYRNKVERRNENISNERGTGTEVERQNIGEEPRRDVYAEVGLQPLSLNKINNYLGYLARIHGDKKNNFFKKDFILKPEILENPKIKQVVDFCKAVGIDLVPFKYIGDREDVYWGLATNKAIFINVDCPDIVFVGWHEIGHRLAAEFREDYARIKQFILDKIVAPNALTLVYNKEYGTVYSENEMSEELFCDLFAKAFVKQDEIGFDNDLRKLFGQKKVIQEVLSYIEKEVKPILEKALQGAFNIEEQFGEKQKEELIKEWYSGGENITKDKGPGGKETSLMQMPSGMANYVEWGIAKVGGTHLDNGAGKYDKGQIYLRKQGVNYIPLDPYNRSEKRNQMAYQAIKENGGVDSANSSNVLNVIRHFEDAINHIKFTYGVLKPGGKLIINVYEGNRSGVWDGSQQNRPLKWYEKFVRYAAPDSKITYIQNGKFMVVEKPLNGKVVFIPYQQLYHRPAGKIVGTSIYIHKDYISDLPEEAQKLVYETMDKVPFDFNLIRVDVKQNEVSYMYSSDFDIAKEPRISKSIKFKNGMPGREVIYNNETAPIYHGKHLFVRESYPGFDYAEAEKRYSQWISQEIVKELGYNTNLIGNPKVWEKIEPYIGNEVKFKKATPKYQLINEELQAKMEAAHGLPEPTFIEIIKEYWEDFKNKITRDFEHLPRTGEFAELRNALHKLERMRGVAQDKSIIYLSNLVKDLTPYEYSLFEYKVIFDDLQEELEMGHPLPWGITKEILEAELARINKDVAENEKITKALKQRQEIWEQIKKDYIDICEKINFKVEERFKRKNYYRHQVLMYARAKSLMGTGKKLKTPAYRSYLLKRQGSELPINTNYLQAEFEVMTQMLYDTQIARTIYEVKRNYDIVPILKKQALLINENKVKEILKRMIGLGIIDVDITNLDEEAINELTNKIYNKLMNQIQAIALSELGMLAVYDQLPDTPDGKFKKVINSLAYYYVMDKKPKQPELDFDITKIEYLEGKEYYKRLFEYLQWLAKQEKDSLAKTFALKYFKGRNLKQRLTKEILGDKYVTWEDIIPEGYVKWQPREGHAFYFGYSIPEILAKQLFEGNMEQLGIKPEDIKVVLVQGAKYTEMVVKEEVALTLDNLSKNEQPNPFQQILTLWKQWQLLMPRRAFKYNVRNFTGDIDALIAGNPSAIKKVPQAWKELKQVFFDPTAEMPPMFKKWFECGGLQGLFQSQEISDINRLRKFKHLMDQKLERQPIEKLTDMPKKVWLAYFDFTRNMTDFREAILRYACFLDYYEQLEKNNGKPDNYGASIREEIDAIRDITDKAYLLSNQLIGAYDEVSVVTKTLAKYLLPFWRWNEVNFVRYVRLFRNAYQDGKLMASIGRKASMLPVKSIFIAANMGKFLVKVSLFSAIVTLWNLLMFGDAEDDLPEDVQDRFHIILGKDEESIYYFSRLGALQDFLDWFGLDIIPRHVRDLLNNRKTIGDILKEMALSPFNKAITALGPYVSIPVGLVLKRKIYPEPFESTVVRDRVEFLFESFGLRDEYIALTGKPSRGYLKSLPGIFIYKADPLQTAYYQIQDIKQQYLEKHGKSAKIIIESEKNNILYNYKLAVRYHDKEAASKYLLEYFYANGTLKGLKRSMQNLEPLYGLNKEEKKDFIKQLSVEEKEDLIKAYIYYWQLIGVIKE